jgi:hypothetical protein
MGRNRWAVVLGIVALIVISAAAFRGGQHKAGTPATPATAAPASSAAPATHAADVQSMDSILAALYDTISGPAGQRRDWAHLHALFVPDAHMIAVGHAPNGEIRTQQFTVDEYIARATPVFEREGFYESEISRHVDTFRNMSQVFSTYESRHARDQQPFQRGINSIQLFHDGHRWWVVNVYWEAESPKHAIPKKYLP